MRLATFVWNQQRHVGVVADDGQSVTSLKLETQERLHGVLAVIDLHLRGEDIIALQGEVLPIEDVHLEAPIPRPRRNIFCVGRNYHEHARELADSVFKSSSAATASWPIVFSKVPECVVGPNEAIQLPGAEVSTHIDYEAELAVIIGRAGKNIRPEDVADHIFGYTIVNDVTARDVQMRHQQWHLGKSFDTFCPMGPWLVTADAFNAHDTRLQCWVNDELRQDARTRDLIFDIPTLIATCSRGITLQPGDIIATGTPAGVGMGMEPPQYLQAGDKVRIDIEGLGVLENRVE